MNISYTKIFYCRKWGENRIFSKIQSESEIGDELTNSALWNFWAKSAFSNADKIFWCDLCSCLRYLEGTLGSTNYINKKIRAIRHLKQNILQEMVQKQDFFKILSESETGDESTNSGLWSFWAKSTFSNADKNILVWPTSMFKVSIGCARVY